MLSSYNNSCVNMKTLNQIQFIFMQCSMLFRISFIVLSLVKEKTLLHKMQCFIRISAPEKNGNWTHVWNYNNFMCDDINNFTFDTMFDPTVLQLIGVQSKHLRVLLGSLRQTSENFGNLRKIFGNVRVTFGQHSEKSSENGRKSLGNCQKLC